MAEPNEDPRLTAPRHVFCGIPTFAYAPMQDDIDNIDADAAILGFPYENGYGYGGARMGPRGIRSASAAGINEIKNGYYHLDDDEDYLGEPWKIVDCGDVPVSGCDVEPTFTVARNMVERVAKSDALLVTLGGDHAVTIPVLEGLAERGPFGIIHIDAHMDWAVLGRPYGHETPMRRASEMDHVTKMAQLGIRQFPLTSKQAVQDALDYGSVIMSTNKVRQLGIDETIARIPKCEKYYLSIDIDGMDLSIAPGTGSPSHGGFLYLEIRELLKRIAGLGEIVAFDLVEVAPPLEGSGSEPTSALAVRIILDLIGFIFKERERRGDVPNR